MDKKTQAMLASYGRSFLAAGISAVLPVAIRAANPKDPAFGKIADGVTEAVVGKLTKKAPAKKASAKK